jgi:hypothetical protein
MMAREGASEDNKLIDIKRDRVLDGTVGLFGHRVLWMTNLKMVNALA